jgi:hypothetical protein
VGVPDEQALGTEWGPFRAETSELVFALKGQHAESLTILRYPCDHAILSKILGVLGVFAVKSFWFNPVIP